MSKTKADVKKSSSETKSIDSLLEACLQKIANTDPSNIDSNPDIAQSYNAFLAHFKSENESEIKKILTSKLEAVANSKNNSDLVYLQKFRYIIEFLLKKGAVLNYQIVKKTISTNDDGNLLQFYIANSPQIFNAANITDLVRSAVPSVENNLANILLDLNITLDAEQLKSIIALTSNLLIIMRYFLAKKLISKGALLEYFGNIGPLMQYAIDYDCDLVKILIEKNGDVNCVIDEYEPVTNTHTYYRPCDYAISTGDKRNTAQLFIHSQRLNPESIKRALRACLVAGGLTLNLFETLITKLEPLTSWNIPDLPNPFIVALNNKLDRQCDLLINRRLFFDNYDAQNSILFCFIQCERYDFFKKVLVTKVIDVNATNHFGETILHALVRKHAPIAILNEMLMYKANVKVLDPAGENLFAIAIKHLNLPAAFRFVTQGVGIDYRSKTGLNAIQTSIGMVFPFLEHHAKQNTLKFAQENIYAFFPFLINSLLTQGAYFDADNGTQIYDSFEKRLVGLKVLLGVNFQGKIQQAFEEVERHLKSVSRFWDTLKEDNSDVKVGEEMLKSMSKPTILNARRSSDGKTALQVVVENKQFSLARAMIYKDLNAELLDKSKCSAMDYLPDNLKILYRVKPGGEYNNKLIRLYINEISNPDKLALIKTEQEKAAYEKTVIEFISLRDQYVTEFLKHAIDEVLDPGVEDFCYFVAETCYNRDIINSWRNPEMAKKLLILISKTSPQYHLAQSLLQDIYIHHEISVETNTLMETFLNSYYYIRATDYFKRFGRPDAEDVKKQTEEDELSANQFSKLINKMIYGTTGPIGMTGVTGFNAASLLSIFSRFKSVAAENRSLVAENRTLKDALLRAQVMATSATTTSSIATTIPLVFNALSSSSSSSSSSSYASQETAATAHLPPLQIRAAGKRPARKALSLEIEDPQENEDNNTIDGKDGSTESIDSGIEKKLSKKMRK